MATKCLQPLRGKRIRLTELDACGNPVVTGTAPNLVTNRVVTDGFITVNLTAEIEDGVEIITRKADGSLCVNERSSNSFKRFNVEITFCGVDPDALTLTTNAEGYTIGGDVVGVTIGEGSIDKEFAMELWTGVANATCGAGEEASGYIVLPRVNAGTVGDITVDGENAINFVVSGAYTKGGNGWGVGPYEVVMSTGETTVAAALPTALDPLDHFLLIQTNVAPPASVCGLQTD